MSLSTNLAQESAHAHEHCIQNALQAALTRCENQGLKLTPLRKQVLSLVWQTHQPVKAYDLLCRLNNREGKPAAPPTVYRALEFLVNAGLIHRLDSLNAFIGCGNPLQAHYGQFLVCRACGRVQELNQPELTQMLQAQAAHLGFEVDHHTLEIHGRCINCQNQPAALESVA